MKNQTRRILFAALLSMTVYGGTYYWYQSTRVDVSNNSIAEEIAYVAEVNEEAHRRPASRLIWQSLNTGEKLYPGESVRTSSQAYIRIQFKNSESYIDLDPDSLIVISQNKNEISLDLMDGSLLVAGGDKKNDGTAITLNSGQGKVDLTQATASLSKSKSGKVDVQVIKGKAKTQDGKDLSVDTSKIKLISPQEGTPYIINPEMNETVKFSWSGFPPEALVTLWVGTSKKDMKSIATTTKAGVTQMERKIQPGRHFFKLVALDPVNKTPLGESQTHRLEVAAKYPPAPISPANEAFLVMDKEKNVVSFKWSRNTEMEGVELTIASDPQFKKPLFNKKFSEEENFSFELPPGVYFWGLSSKYEGVEKALSSKVQKFTISSKPKNKITISWNDKEEQKPFYFVDKPVAALGWTANPKDDVKKWRLVIWPQEAGREPASEVESAFETEKAFLKFDLPKAGRYYAAVEAYNEFGTLLAKSSTRALISETLPLLKAPNFFPQQGLIRADNRGTLKLQWTKFTDAKEYHVLLFDSEGKEVKKEKFVNNAGTFSNLMPGQYKIDVYAIDNHGRESMRNQPRQVLVPDTSDLKAPKLKKVRVN